MNSYLPAHSNLKMSILLPSYNYTDGLIRILERLEPCIARDIEIIIGDNSDNDEIRTAISPWADKYPDCIKYFWNNPTKTPIQNWNFLLDKAYGEYVWMIHHDEYPESNISVGELLEAIRRNPLVDIFLLSCQLTFAGGDFIRPHFNVNIRDWLLRHAPIYLLRRNIIGPTGMLVVRRSLYPRFDLRLIWLVDVDLYVRLFCSKARWISCHNVFMRSEQERTSSLTKGLGSSIGGIYKAELEYLQNRMGSRDIWIGPYLGESMGRKLIRFLEALIWYSYRVITKSFAFISYKLRVNQ